MGGRLDFSTVRDLRYGRDPILDAWLLHFMTENNLEHSVAPDVNASEEQIRFMVALQEQQVFVPCSDWMFRNLLEKKLTPRLLAEYKTCWRQHSALVHGAVPESYVRRKIISLSRHKLNNVLVSPFVIPSRFIKNLTTILLTQSGQEDPFRDRKAESTARAKAFISGAELDRALNSCPSERLSCRRIEDLRWELDLLELRRLLTLSTYTPIWSRDGFRPDWTELRQALDAPAPLLDAILTNLLGPHRADGLKVLYLPNRSGGVLFDILAVRVLLRLGCKVIMALKEGFDYHRPTFWDVENDPVLMHALEGAFFLEDPACSKNRLLAAQRENPFLVISDGTRERLNLYRTSITFARAWKESDLIIAKGRGNFRRLILTSHEFTRDVLCVFREDGGRERFFFKSRSASSVHFPEHHLIDRAEQIIREARRAKEMGCKVMFYSAIIGSIPGQTATAIRILNRFVDYLRDRLEKTYIINPAEYFEKGMDADDLMFMWERVQRSGTIDVWRFQSVEDIEKSFELLREKVPPVWNGKDATYSTGCTKEMRIALDMQKTHPELQIIGPSPEKFFRRREYGVGKFFDASIESYAAGRRV